MMLATNCISAVLVSTLSATGMTGSGPSAEGMPSVITDTTLAVKVGGLATGEGGGFIVIRNGRIDQVGADKAPEGAWVLDHSSSTASAGLVDIITSLGASGDLDEPARPLTPEARAADSFRPSHSSFRKAAQGGLTSVGLSPGSANLVGGQLALVRTAGEGGASLAGDGPLRLCLSSRAFQPNRKPTSRMGAMHAMRQWVKGGVPGKGALVIDVQTADEIRLCLDLLKDTGRPLVFLNPSDPTNCIELLRGTGSSVVLGPYGPATATRTLRAAGLLEAAGITVAFTGNGNPASLRMTAALAVAEGMTSKGALAAITQVPASLLGMKDVGVLQKGARADLFIGDGSPLDLGAAVRAVIAGGALVDLENE